ncbi:unnamed protein product, partial [Pylaiella littoralis]
MQARTYTRMHARMEGWMDGFPETFVFYIVIIWLLVAHTHSCVLNLNLAPRSITESSSKRGERTVDQLSRNVRKMEFVVRYFCTRIHLLFVFLFVFSFCFSDPTHACMCAHTVSPLLLGLLAFDLLLYCTRCITGLSAGNKTDDDPTLHLFFLFGSFIFHIS